MNVNDEKEILKILETIHPDSEGMDIEALKKVVKWDDDRFHRTLKSLRKDFRIKDERGITIGGIAGSKTDVFHTVRITEKGLRFLNK